MSAEGEEVLAPRRTLSTALLLFALFFAVYATLAAQKDFSSRGESREALVVKDMIAQENLILPLRNGVDIPSKPPLFHWLGVFSVRSLNLPADLGVRLPSAASAALILMLFSIFVAERFGARTSLLTVLICATTFEWSRSAVLARVDMLFSALLAGAFMLFARVLSSTDEGERRRHFFLIGGLLGLATLTKGPIGVALPWIAFAVTWVVTSLPGMTLSRALAELRVGAVSVGVSLFVATCWYLPAYVAGGSEFVEIHLFKENVARLMHSPGYEVGHNAPFYSMFFGLLGGFLPWSLLLPVLVVWVKREWSALRQDTTLLFSFVWLAVFLLIFSISESKRTVYMLPAYLPLALLLARAVSSLGSVETERWICRSFEGFGLFLLVASGALAVALLIVAAFPARWVVSNAFWIQSADALRAGLRANWWLLVAALFGVWGTDRSFRALRNGEFMRGCLGCAGAGILVSVVTGMGAVVPLSRVSSPTLFAERLELTVPADAMVLQFRHDFYPLLVDVTRNIPRVLDETLPLGDYYVVSAARDSERLRELVDRFELVFESDGPQADGRDALLLARVSKQHGGLGALRPATQNEKISSPSDVE